MVQVGKKSIELISITNDAEKVIENAGRTCWKSFDKQTQTTYVKFIKMLINKGHFSVLEHCSATFRINGRSRSFTHQLVRHRLSSFSQESQRYVDSSQFNYTTPLTITNNKKALDLYNRFMNVTNDIYNHLRELDIPGEDARFVLPNACHSEIVITANFRQWRHIFEERCVKAAQWEIRECCMQILNLLSQNAPIVFGDQYKKFNTKEYINNA